MVCVDRKLAIVEVPREWTIRRAAKDALLPVDLMAESGAAEPRTQLVTQDRIATSVAVDGDVKQRLGHALTSPLVAQATSRIFVQFDERIIRRDGASCGRERGGPPEAVMILKPDLGHLVAKPK